MSPFVRSDKVSDVQAQVDATNAVMQDNMKTAMEKLDMQRKVNEAPKDAEPPEINASMVSVRPNAWTALQEKHLKKKQEAKFRQGSHAGANLFLKTTTGGKEMLSVMSTT